MYKILDTDLLDITGRQSEVIELALTYGFGGINVDMEDLSKRSQRSSFENASRFLVSSKLNIASFRVPISLDDDEATFESRFAQLAAIADVAGRCQARTAVLDVPNGTDRLPYPEYFEVVRKRIDRIAGLFSAAGVRLGLKMSAVAQPSDKQFKFVREVDGLVALLKSCSSKNVGLVLDTWNWHLGGGKLSHLDDLGVDRVCLVQLADCKEGVDVAATTDDDRLLPGSTGVIDNSAWLVKLGTQDIGVAAYGAASEEVTTRDAFIGLVQDSLNEVFAASGLPTHTRKPDSFIESAAGSSAELVQGGEELGE
jgi:sugar phosphate isomerase/epimerase